MNAVDRRTFWSSAIPPSRAIRRSCEVGFDSPDVFRAEIEIASQIGLLDVVRLLQKADVFLETGIGETEFLVDLAGFPFGFGGASFVPEGNESHGDEE